MIGYCEVPDPIMVSEVIPLGQEEIHSLVEMDEMILENCGYGRESARYKMILENVVSDEDEKKIFTVDKTRSYGIKGATECILKDEFFDKYWRKRIYDNLTDEKDGKLLEQWDDAFIGNEVERALLKLSKVEKINYVDFFREILLKSENPDAVKLIDFDDPLFSKMPNVMRLY